MLRKFIYLFIFVLLLSYGYAQKTIKVDAPFPMRELVVPQFADKDFVITDFGAKQDDQGSCSKAIKSAVEACSKNGGGRVVIPSGHWLTGPIHLKSNINLHLAENAVLKFSDNPEDYLPVVFTRYGGYECYNYSPLVYAVDCENIAVTGKGTLDGNGQKWWTWTKPKEKLPVYTMVLNNVPVEKRIFGKPEFALRPSFIQFIRCKNVLFEDFTVTSGPFWTVHPVYCSNVIARKINVITRGSNNDGFDIDSSSDVLIEDCFFDTEDDCLVLKSGENEDGWRVGKPTENVVIRNIRTKMGNGGVVFGSEMSGGIRNVYVHDCFFDGTDRGIRMKSVRGRGGYIENIWINNIGMKNIIRDVLLIDMFYKATMLPATQTPSVFRDIFIQNIFCEKSNGVFIISGLPDKSAENIQLRNVCVMSAQKGAACNDVKDLLFDGICINTSDSIAWRMNNAQDIKIKNLTLAGSSKIFMEVKGKSSNVRVNHANFPYVEKIILEPEAGLSVVKISND